jgi:predicted small metal-binding protein
MVDTALQCNCGFVARAAGEDGLLAEVQRHAWEAHGMTLSQDEALVLIIRAELTAASTTPHGTTPPREKEDQ